MVMAVNVSSWFYVSLFCCLLFGENVENNPLLIFSTTKDIRIANLTRTFSSNKIKNTILIRNLTDGPAIDYHFKQKKICWANHGLESIQCMEYYMNNSMEIIHNNKTETVISGVLSAVGLAIDWYTDKLYWTDSEANRIEVATMDGRYRKVLFWTDIDQPRAIALAPMKGFMFWTDWGEIPKIERSSMNGNPQSRRVIVSNNIFWPNGLTIDYKEEKVFWIDGRLQFIESMSYDGLNRTVIIDSKFEYPFALTTFETKLYWTDWKTWSVHSYHQSTKETKELIHLSDLVPMDIHVLDEKRQPVLNHHNPCAINNGGCSHLCLLSSPADEGIVGHTCACPTGIKLETNETCLKGPQELLLLAKRTDICLIYLDSPDYTIKQLPLHDIKYTIAVDYDPIDGHIYWTDDEVKKIQRAHLNGSAQEDVINEEIQHPDGLAIDWISRTLYWTDTGTDRIEMSRINRTELRRVIISDNLYEPRAIVVAPELGWLFWSDWSLKWPKIERSNLDGTERLVIITKNLGWPNGLTLDFAQEKIYWCDAKLDKIEYSYMDGSDRRELITDNVPHVFGFSLMGDYLYWTDWQRRTVDRAHKETGGQRQIIIEQIANVMGLKAIQLQNNAAAAATTTNPCNNDNGNCSHFCFYRHNKTYVCGCKLGYELSNIDKRTCLKPSVFFLYTKRDQIGRIGLENVQNEMTIPISGTPIKHASAIDFETTTQRIYWCDSKLKTIWRAFLNGSQSEKIIDLGLSSPESIAIDWFGLNIYWTDSQTHKIQVARLQGSSRRTLLWNEIYEPHSIVLDPFTGYMYWSEWGQSNSIKKAAMDGSSIGKLLTTNMPANDLTLDLYNDNYRKQRLYWIEMNDLSSSSAILSSDLNGNDKRIVIKNNQYSPVSLAIFNNFLYWSDQRTNAIFKMDKANNSQQLLKMDQLNIIGGPLTDLIVFHYNDNNGNNKSVAVNQCSVSNGGCSHLCLTVPGQLPEEPIKYKCACPTHYTLYENTKCLPPQAFMIYSLKNLLTRLLPDTRDCPEAVLPIQGLKNVKAIDFDQLTNIVYWIEGKVPSIKRAELNAGAAAPQTIVNGNAANLLPFDLVVDTIGRLLFWTCAAQDVINVTRLDNYLIPFGGVIVQKDNEKPRLLAIHPIKRLLFYTNIVVANNGEITQLIRTRLDGSHRIVITKVVTKSDTTIAAIAVDLENDLIVWAQGQNIYIANIDGENQHVLLNESNSRITQLTVYSGWLYWLDRELNQLERLELLSGGKSRSTVSIVQAQSNIIDIISVGQFVGARNQSCATKKCSHLCILNGTNSMCACPKGNMLKEDKKTCSTLLDCGVDRFTCTVMSIDDKDCIPISWRCDGQEDCLDGSDELDCPDNCSTNEQFKCLDGLNCINSQNVCDGIAHCQDKSDENNCCKEDSFQCRNTQVCLPYTLVCDKIDHCIDGSDEHASICQQQQQHHQNNSPQQQQQSNILVIIAILCVIMIVIICAFVTFNLFRRRFMSRLNQDQVVYNNNYENSSQQQDWINPASTQMLKTNNTVVPSNLFYDRNHLTGASSSTTNGSSLLCYPRETLNPPPSPATPPAVSIRDNNSSSPPSSLSTTRHYYNNRNHYNNKQHYKVLPPPPPTPCSTDVCDESDYNYPTRSRYYDGGGHFPPPPTPRSHCHSTSCPPSPSSRSSTS